MPEALKVRFRVDFDARCSVGPPAGLPTIEPMTRSKVTLSMWER
jgi:hypothetical protein